MTARFLFLMLSSIVSIFVSAQTNHQADGYDLPLNFYEANCIFQTEKFDMSIVQKHISDEDNVSTYFSAVVGDLDRDGYSEIVIPGGATHNAADKIFIFEHNAILRHTIVLPLGLSMHTDYDSVVLGDLDNDGKSEIIVTASNAGAQNPVMLVYDYEGNLLAQSSIPTKFPKAIGIADFDKDGLAEIYVGNRVYAYSNGSLIPIAQADGTSGAVDNTLEPTVAQDIDGDDFLDLVSVNTSYKVVITNRDGTAGNSVTQLAKCNSISNVPSTGVYRTRTFALADLDLDGEIDVVSLVPLFSPNKIEVTVWNPQTGAVKYSKIIDCCAGGSFIRVSWPFIGDTDGNRYPDIIFMGGINVEGCTSVYRLEYDKASNDVVIRKSSDKFNDFSSMSTSMSMFDFNNDGKQDVVYRDESSLYILNGETLAIMEEIEECHSGTGWEYPVVASLTPSGESSVIMCSGSTTKALFGTLRIYGADVRGGKKPWIPARKVWNQFAFYQNTICDNLKTIAKPAPLNITLTSDDGTKTMQPFNGHMFQLGIIRPSSLESVYPLADIVIDEIDYGYNRTDNELTLNIEISNSGSAPMDPDIPVNIYKFVGKDSVLVHSHIIDHVLDKDATKSMSFSIANFEQFLPFDSLVVKVADGKYDCDTLNNRHAILPIDISNILYVKKGESGTGGSWKNSMGEVEDALQKAKDRNIKYPNSISEIWVAEGDYFGNFEMQEGVNIYGGFYGEETEIEESRPLEHPTVLDAQDSGRPLTQLVEYRTPTEWRGLILQNGNVNEDGGGALLKKGSTLSYSTIRNNTTTSAKGGGVCMDNSKVINCIIEHNTIANTLVGQGAGIYAINSSVATNNTVVKNSIASQNAQGAGIYSSASSIHNNIIFGNVGIANPSNLYATSSTVSNNLSNEDDSVDPLFYQYEEDNYRLLPTSPALNKGDNTYIAGWSMDVEGNERIYENRIVDQGAFEYQGRELALSKEGYFYVNKTKDGNGADWTSAATELSEVLAGAKLLNESAPNTVKEIWVASGTYHGVFEMVEGANVRGGFAGNETDFSKIDTVANKTYIDAQGLGRALTQTTDFSTPTEWAGVILQNGVASGIDHDVYGGGAYLRKNGIIRYSTIRNSKAVATSNFNKVNAYGGGLYLEEGASIQNSIIDNNIAEVKNNSPSTIQNGVALGGGINNNKNRLDYLVVRNNKTISGGSTDGSAIYTSGDIVNNIINGNKGKSTIFLGDNQSVINTTIVDNVATYTLASTGGAKAKNNIVYGNQNSETNFSQVEYEPHNNLVDVDPSFEGSSYKLQTISKARAIGNANYFPTDISVDFEGNLRFFTLKNRVKVIDAGAYQSNIKVESTIGNTIEVPFGTKFEDLGLKDAIDGSLEHEYEFDSNITWNESGYNELEVGEHILSGDLSNLPAGVINPDNVQGTTKVVVRQNHISEVGGLIVNDEEWKDNIGEGYLIDCDCITDKLPIEISLPHFASIKFEPQIEYTQVGNSVFVEPNISKPGNHKINIVLTSQDGKSVTTYPLMLIKYFPFWSIIEQKWNNTFVINNNQDNNGGYEFATYKWYKEGKSEPIGTRQYYSAGGSKTDLLDEASLYRAEMIDVDGVGYATCQERPVLMRSGLKVYPNPVRVGGSLTIEAPLAEGQKGSVAIYSLSGLPVKDAPLKENITTIDAPANAGLYIVKVSLEGGVSESMRVIVY